MPIPNRHSHRLWRFMLAPGLLALGLLTPASGQTTDTLTREVSVWNNPQAYAAQVDTVTREVSTWNNPQAFAVQTDFVSREVSTWNNPQVFTLQVEAITREVSTWNNPVAFFTASDTLTREVSVQAGAVDPFTNVRKALSIAGGRTQSTGADMTALNVVLTAPSSNKIDLLDAIRLARKVAGLDP